MTDICPDCGRPKSTCERCVGGSESRHDIYRKSACQAATIAKLRARVAELEAQISALDCGCGWQNRTGGGHAGDCYLFEPECACYEIHGTAHQPGCYFHGEARRKAESAREGAWVPAAAELPDSDVWVLAVNHESDYVVVQLEFTDDSEGHGEPYWAAAGGDLALCNYPYWCALPAPPTSEDG